MLHHILDLIGWGSKYPINLLKMGHLCTLLETESILCIMCKVQKDKRHRTFLVQKTLIFYIIEIVVSMVFHNLSFANQASFDKINISFHGIKICLWENNAKTKYK